MKQLLCKDFGVDCPVVFRGESVEELLEQAKQHGREAHGKTEEQVNAPEVRKIAEEKSREI